MLYECDKDVNDAKAGITIHLLSSFQISVYRSSKAGLDISTGCASAGIVPAGGGQEEGGGGDKGEEDEGEVDVGGWRGWKTCKRFIP